MGICFCREVFGFCCEVFVFVVRSLVLPWSVYHRVAGGTLLISLSTKPNVVMIHRKVRGHSQSDIHKLSAWLNSLFVLYIGHRKIKKLIKSQLTQAHCITTLQTLCLWEEKFWFENLWTYGGPQLSRQNQKPQGKNKIPHDKTENLTAKTKYLTTKTKPSGSSRTVTSQN